MVSAVIGLVILPWNLYDSPIVINYFLGGLGAFLGPLFGIVMADYWLVRKQRIDVPTLYTDDPTGPYSLPERRQPEGDRGVRPRRGAVAASSRSCPPARRCPPFSWFIAAGLGAVVYSCSPTARADLEDVTARPSPSRPH